jgi:hypothetical protein
MCIFARQKYVSVCLQMDNEKNMRENYQRLFETAVIEFARRDSGKPWACKVRMCGGLAKNKSWLCCH